MISWMYIWRDSLCFTCEGMAAQVEKKPDRYVLVIAAEGGGLLWIDEKEYTLAKGRCFIIKPGAAMRIANRSDDQTSVHIIEFDILPTRTDVGGPNSPTPDSLPEGAIQPRPSSRILQLAQTLYDHRKRLNEQEEYENHLWFQELIFKLMKAADENKELQAIQAVEQAIQQMRDSLNDDFTLGQLAENAGLSPRHFSRIFRTLTNKSPIDYLIEQRMSKAKLLLLDSKDTIHEIANAIGFRDPFHFSRSFKQHTGVSPRLYVHMRKQPPRVASLQFLGEMLALGIKPIGAPSQLLTSRYYQTHVEGIEVVGSTVVTPHLEKLNELKPDVIVTFDGYHYSDYSKIAPTLDVSWSLPFFERFRYIAQWIGRSDEAEQWMDRYRDIAEQSKDLISHSGHEKETVSFFWLRGLPQQVEVYYDVGVLYRDLACQAPPAIAAAQAREGHPFKERIRVAELPLYAGDHMFVVVSRDPESEALFQELQQTPMWQELPAVRNNMCYRLTEDWLREDPVSMMGQLVDAANTIRRSAYSL
ncbi:helix-turn-helix domain-containing protein [Paenibacillus gorillae]|uniref:helix-turn-helix domain-containing protein n=1 Tax=Paenibacillus gorillae TaxID=1243662 RepID=UPI0005A8B416|nr:helix-turn-helix domain-containing protein [Paenibacillus gorillae]